MSVHSLHNDHGLDLRVANRGGIILSLKVPDRDGRLDDVVLGYDAEGDYTDDPSYFGAIIGRFANRIAHSRFTLDGREYELTANQPPHHLHGGEQGFAAAIWAVEPVLDDEGPGLQLHYTSPHGEEGYPGTLEVGVRYTVTDANELVVTYTATTDRTTPLNLTQHSYFNLAGHDAGDVLGHVVTIPADRFTPVDDDLIPMGELRDVAGTPLDFTEPTPLGARIRAPDEQLERCGGYDHNYVLSGSGDGRLRLAARVYEPGSGRVLEVRTTEPGLQLYSGNHLDGVAGKHGAVYGRHAGLALETQHFPDSPNQPTFPSTILRPDETFRSRTVYRFSTRDD